MVEAVKAELAKRTLPERAVNVERQRRAHFYDWLNVPHGQRR